MIVTKIQTRFSDVDILGHVNNVHQQQYFDLGKCDFYQQVLGLTPYWGNEGIIIVASNTTFMTQTRREEQLIVETRLIKVGTKSFTLDHKLINAATGEVKSDCQATLVAFDFVNQRSFVIPDWWRERFTAEMQRDNA